MRIINLIVVHCSATRENCVLTPQDLDLMHRRGRPADTRTSEQKASLRLLVHQLQEAFPGCRVCGHRDLSPDLNGNGEIEPEEWVKMCPCFEVKTQSKTIF